MKYIRTKDEIYSYEPTHNIDVDGFIIQHVNGWEKPLMKEDIFKIADTIEELCDEFVFHVENQGHWIINNYKKALEIAKSFNEDENKFICYGAIWTDKGLIYVAKMNDKGELCLL